MNENHLIEGILYQDIHYILYILFSIFNPHICGGVPISAQTLHCPEFAVLHIQLHSRQLVFAPTSTRE